MIHPTPSIGLDCIGSDTFDVPPPPNLTLPLWLNDPVARRFTDKAPAKRVLLAHRTFSEARLYRDERGGGAVILRTQDMRVLAMDHADPVQLDVCWREAVSFYLSAGLPLQSMFCA